MGVVNDTEMSDHRERRNTANQINGGQEKVCDLRERKEG